MDNIYSCIIKAVRYAVCGQSFKPGDIDFDAVFECAKRHGVENMIYVALRDLNITVPVPVMSKFEQEYQKAIMSEAVQAIELESLSMQMDASEIDHIPLKGSVIKYLYPMPDLRKSSDIDILIKPQSEKKAIDILVSNGYSLIEDGDTHDIHITYYRPPMLLLELHRALIRSKNRAYAFCESVWENVSLCENTQHRYEMSNEFMYVYLMAHLAKHLYSGGGGIRLITDIYLAHSKLVMDSHKLNTFLKKAQLTDINEMVLKLADRWFKGTETDDKNIDLLENIVLTGGSFGNTDTKKIIDGNVSEKTKFRRFFKMIFPPRFALVGKYPVLKKYGFLLPVVWIYRAFSLFVFKRNSVMTDIKATFDIQDKDDTYSELLKAVCDK